MFEYNCEVFVLNLSISMLLLLHLRWILIATLYYVYLYKQSLISVCLHHQKFHLPELMSHVCMLLNTEVNLLKEFDLRHQSNRLVSFPMRTELLQQPILQQKQEKKRLSHN